ncbi:DUF2298 domain-containing protein [Patescibacteria group bacterium]
MGTDLWLVVQWWAVLFLFGVVAYPITRIFFSHWWDQGYGLSKAVGLAVVTYIVWLGAMAHILPFSVLSIAFALGVTFVFGLLMQGGVTLIKQKKAREFRAFSFPIIVIEELFFYLLLLLWSWVKGHNADIHGLEKFMDYGFTQSILNSRFFPAADIWYAGETINYYTFGHTVLAVLTKISQINLAYTFNLMLATLFALTATMSFTIGVQLMLTAFRSQKKPTHKDTAIELFRIRTISILGGVVSAFLVTSGGNLQTIYAFTKGYVGENVVPFWTIFWARNEFDMMVKKIPDYWYANATRFIPFTIHEFPSYSFVVSDVHGHVLSLPFVLLAIALMITLFTHKRSLFQRVKIIEFYVFFFFYGLLLSILFMTNALDGPIYFGLFCMLLLFIPIQKQSLLKQSISKSIALGIVSISAFVLLLPFFLTFDSFVNGIGVNCPPSFLVNKQIGLFIFEGVEKCQHSPLWMALVLWGFFLYCGAWLFGYGLFQKQHKFYLKPHERVLFVIFMFCVMLLIFPEFLYFKDIYPAHFRSNTMFKLGYQAFIMLGLISGYSIFRLLTTIKKIQWKVLFLVFLIPQLFLVSLYPFLATRTYFHNLKAYKGLYGLKWLEDRYPNDYIAIDWLNDQYAKSDRKEIPVIVEAAGESYTDYERYSAFTGFSTVIGWSVHEWLWRGSYDIAAPRIEEVRVVYESEDYDLVRDILIKYKVTYIIVGKLEREKYTIIDEVRFEQFGTRVFQSGNTVIYSVF